MIETRAPNELTFVSVVFTAEIRLLRLQARSLAIYLDPECVEEFLVLDNCTDGMSSRAIRALKRELGPTLESKLSILRTRDLGVDTAAHGWRSQQAAKLLVARRIRTPHYVVLDAKNHLIAPVGVNDFVDAAGTPNGGTHTYVTHPLRRDLERTLRYFNAEEDTIGTMIADFPPTATPFVMTTGTVRQLLDDVENRSGRSFVNEFERANLLEFFLYSAWSMLRGAGLPVNGSPIQSPVIWFGAATKSGAISAISAVDRTDAAWFAVHRRALMRGDAAMRDVVIRFWADRGLMSVPEGKHFIRAFRRAYFPSVARTRVTERMRALRRRKTPDTGRSEHHVDPV